MTAPLLSDLDAIPKNGRFVILEHQVPPGGIWTDHWDVMLESPAGLLTWASPPFCDRRTSWEVEPLPIHRTLYLDYEGAISGNRGCVRRVDRGQFAVQDRQPGAVVVQLAGERFHGQLRLERRSDGGVDLDWLDAGPSTRDDG
jgi:hypothetical protein